jgi:bifunctional non-homologous end joining protein LigD
VDEDDGGPSDEDRAVGSGRTMAQIAAGEGRGARPFMNATSQPKPVSVLPAFIEPQLARSLDKPPSGPGWAHEICAKS